MFSPIRVWFIRVQSRGADVAVFFLFPSFIHKVAVLTSTSPFITCTTVSQKLSLTLWTEFWYLKVSLVCSVSFTATWEYIYIYIYFPTFAMPLHIYLSLSWLDMLWLEGLRSWVCWGYISPRGPGFAFKILRSVMRGRRENKRCGTWTLRWI